MSRSLALGRAFSSPFTLLWQHRELILAIARRELAARYRGSALGVVWLLLAPLLMLAVYSFVFGVVFQVRWGGIGESRLMFAAVLFCGIAIFGLFAEVINRSPQLVLSQVNYVKKVVFPLEVLSCALVLSSAVNFLIALFVLLVFIALSMGMPPLTVLALPVLLIPFLLGLLSVSWMLAALGVYVRDIAQLTGLLATALMFMCPVFYPLSVVPAAYQPYLWLNPMTHVVEAMRAVLIHGELPSAATVLWWWGIALVMMVCGGLFFRRLRPGFADVM
ncbi:MAG: ABC transporter permease [Thauera sp.]|jgi:lipopolysaccharide transport system permease protein|nr:ABC transporter permease [Thauera sp.]